ncbi:MAG: BTAD domain-containing putative transcriptional regulator [Pseudoflavonifractor sp.]
MINTAAWQKVSVTLLGGFTMTVDGKVLTDEINRSQKLWNILTYLVVHQDRRVPQTELVEQFWPGEHSANPVNALKTLLYRVRALVEPLFAPGAEPIVTRRGSYGWNPALHCRVDADCFETLCREGEDPSLSRETRLDLLRRAQILYRGDFLPKLAGELWTIPLTAHYHSLYLKATKALAALLEEDEAFEEMEQLALRAGEIDELDEEIHILIVRALLRQGKNTAALAHYETATERLYRNLGVRPSKALRDLYIEMMSVEQGLEMDLEVIQNDLREAAERPGAFVCEYGFFQEAYRLEVRRAARSGSAVHVALVTVSLPNGDMPPLGVLANTMAQLLPVLVDGLRRGDVLAKYSSAQYVLMLPAANFEDSTRVLERMIATFYRQHRRNFLKLSYKIRALE